MEHHLGDADWFAAERYTIADIALYAYTNVAEEGGFDLVPYPAVRRWLNRVRAQPRHIGQMDETSATAPLPFTAENPLATPTS
jgi:glutathione S-transferase